MKYTLPQFEIPTQLYEVLLFSNSNIKLAIDATLTWWYLTNFWSAMISKCPKLCKNYTHSSVDFSSLRYFDETCRSDAFNYTIVKWSYVKQTVQYYCLSRDLVCSSQNVVFKDDILSDENYLYRIILSIWHQILLQENTFRWLDIEF